MSAYCTEESLYKLTKMKLSFSLAASKTKPVGETPSLKRPAGFSLTEDEGFTDAAFTSSADRKASSSKNLLAQNVKPSKARLKQMEAEKKVDATVYEYDEVWDKMQETKLKQKEAKEAESKERKASHIRLSPFRNELLNMQTCSPSIFPGY